MKEYIGQLLENQLFFGIKEKEMGPMLKCLNGFIKTYKKGEYIIFEQDIVHNIGIVLEGRIDMIKEDIWGNKTTLVHVGTHELFGETFACGKNPSAAVSFYAAANSKILFLPFDRVMHTCTMACEFHHRVIENMVTIIAEKNRRLMEKVDIISKKSLREKILAYLSQQAQIQGAKYFEVPLGRLEMADYLCTNRSALTRELTSMKEEGILDYDKNMFQLL